MEKERLRQWEESVDSSEANPFLGNLPTDSPIGLVHDDLGTDGVRRRFIRVHVVAGRVGSRWAYWKHGTTGIDPEFRVIVDSIFNGDAPHFAGMLAIPYGGLQTHPQAWVLIQPRVVPERVSLQRERPYGLRYERSKEVYDVETGESRKV